MESFTMNGFTDHLVKFGDIRRQGKVPGSWGFEIEGIQLPKPENDLR